MSNVKNLTYLVKSLMEGDNLSLILSEIKKDIALEILHTKPNESAKREELYYTTAGLDRLEMKLQEYVNTYEGEN